MYKVSGNVFGILRVFLFCSVIFIALKAGATEYSLEADVDARVEYNSNIFLTSAPHSAVSGLVVTPSLSGIIKERHWETELRARIKNYNYSDSAIDTTDQFFDLTGRYVAERNIFSLNVNHNLASNINISSSDFGVIGRRVNTRNQSITPQYTRLLTERAVLILSYTYTDVDYLEAENTGFTPYVTETVAGTYIYDLSERDKLTLSLFAVDYTSRNELVTYQLFMTRIGIEHEFTETLSVDVLLGVSRRNSTNLQTQSFDFNGQLITTTQEIDSKDRGFVLDVGVTKIFETGQFGGRLSRDNTTNSFGGLDQVDKLTMNYEQKLSPLWRYLVRARIEDITSISSGTRATDRDILFFESKVFYSISEKWRVNASYRYVQRKFKSNTSDSRAPHSNRIYLGLTYNFPSLSTF